MKNLTVRLTIAVATLAAAAVSASAQTYKADIPMAFHADGKLMTPGTYDFVVMLGPTGHKTVIVRSHRAANESALLVTIAGSDAPKAWREEGAPKISFECTGHSCSLASLYNGRDVAAYRFPHPKVAPAEKERIASITLNLTRTD